MPIYSFSDGNTSINILSVQIPKTGTSALAHYLKNIGFNEHFGIEHQSIRSTMRCPPQHYDYELLDQLFDLDRLNYSFAITRNPFDRIKSDYKWAMANSKKLSSNPMPFSKWLKYALSNYEKNSYFLANHIKPQYKFIGPKITRTFKYETGLESIISEVFRDTGINLQGDLALPKVNVSENKHIEISETARNRIADFYAKDFKYFGYE